MKFKHLPFQTEVQIVKDLDTIWGVLIKIETHFSQKQQQQTRFSTIPSVAICIINIIQYIKPKHSANISWLMLSRGQILSKAEHFWMYVSISSRVLLFWSISTLMSPSDHSFSSHTKIYLQVFAKSSLKKTMKQQMCKNNGFPAIKKEKTFIVSIEKWNLVNTLSWDPYIVIMYVHVLYYPKYVPRTHHHQVHTTHPHFDLGAI